MGRAARRPGARAPGARGRRLLLAALAAPGAGDEFHVVYEDLMRLPPGATGSDLFGSAHFRLHVRRQMAGALALVEGMPSPWYAVADDLNVTSCEVMEDTNAAATRVDNGVVGGRKRVQLNATLTVLEDSVVARLQGGLLLPLAGAAPWRRLVVTAADPWTSTVTETSTVTSVSTTWVSTTTTYLPYWLR
ncbi:unnamed protein product [Prorocentrum cordatum]|uniref:Uncharacterized protein n=1 Tax=Prorocentrum cordatum TaxID=2364126 RepID=A0ABN9QRH0_9DINO|nr:unnamed protein product [Polarella glacialis]